MQRGDIILVFSHRLGMCCDPYDCLAGGGCYLWRACKSRPCWISEVCGDHISVVPFSTTRATPVVFEPGEGGLSRRSFLKPSVYTLNYHATGPYIGWLDPKTVIERIESSVPLEELETWEEVIGVPSVTLSEAIVW